MAHIARNTTIAITNSEFRLCLFHSLIELGVFFSEREQDFTGQKVNDNIGASPR